MRWNEGRIECHLRLLVTPLITIMEDQVEYLNKIGVAAAMMGEDMDETFKSGSCEIVY